MNTVINIPTPSLLLIVAFLFKVDTVNITLNLNVILHNLMLLLGS